MPTDQSHLDEPILTIPWHPAVDPTTVPWSTRTRNILTRLGIINDREALLALTPRQLLDADHVGPVTLDDFTATVEAQMQATIDGLIVTRQEVLDQVEALRRDLPIDQVPCNDPRLDLDLQGGTISEALDGKGPAGGLTVGELHEAVGAARTELERILAQDPREALRELAVAVLRSPHTDAVVRRLGWDGGGGCTLEVAAEGTGVSWQRIHQLEARLLEALEERWWPLPEGVGGPTSRLDGLVMSG